MTGNRLKNISKPLRFFLITFFIVSVPLISKATKPLTLTDDLKEVCLCREYVRYFEDTTGNLSISHILPLDKEKHFKESTAEDLINDNVSSAYWLNFNLKSQTDKSFRIELFDFHIDEISLYIPDENGNYIEQKAGFSIPFDKREVKHKNISFRVEVPKGTTQSVYMRFKSTRKNVLEPIVRSYEQFLNYGFTEYILFGLFYGLILFMIFYNLLYYILLRKSYFLYYVIFASGILLYIVSENGTGFQYLWPDYPNYNTYSSLIGLFVGIEAMLLFALRFLRLPKFPETLLIVSIFVRLGIFCVQVAKPDYYNWKLFDFFFIQLVLIAGISNYKYKPAKWFIVAFALLDISFLISGLEHLGVLPSSILTVYSFNMGVVLQFTFLSIGTGESIRETYRLKNEADAKLIQEYKKNDELKEKVNRELEQLVKERTVELEKQNMKVQNQKEEIRAMYENLEIIVKNRTAQLEKQNSKIREYTFSNSHLVRAPLARILGLIYIAKKEKKLSVELLAMVENNAKELDKVVREMNRILEKNTETSAK